MNKNSFVLYVSYQKHFAKLTREEQGDLIMAIFEYVETGKEIVSASEAVNMALSFICSQIRYDNDQYISKCEKNRINGEKGGRPTKTERFSEKPKKPNGFKKTLNDNDNDIDNDIIKEEIYKEESPKKTRHKYGRYNNVLLSDEDVEKLKSEFPNDWQARIERVSEYVASTGKSYKNFLAVIRTWARNEKPVPQQRLSKNTAEAEIPKYSNFSADDALSSALARTYGNDKKPRPQAIPPPTSQNNSLGDADDLFLSALKRTYG